MTGDRKYQVIARDSMPGSRMVEVRFVDNALMEHSIAVPTKFAGSVEEKDMILRVLDAAAELKGTLKG